MKIRFAVPDDIEDIATLWCDAFPGKRTVADRIRMLETGGPYGGLETVLVAREEAQQHGPAQPIVTDILEGAGPLGGIHAALVWARNRGACAHSRAEPRCATDRTETKH
mgnify:CR=1 FL=1